MQRHPFVATLLGVLAGVFDRQVMAMKTGQALTTAAGMGVQRRAGTGKGVKAHARAAQKRRNVIANRKAHRHA